MFRYSRDHAIAVAEELENEIFGANETEGERIGEAAAVIRSMVKDRDDLVERATQMETMAARLNAESNYQRTARPLVEWTPADGAALWFTLPITGRMWCGSPTDDDWTGAYTHWTPAPKPDAIYAPVTRGM